MSKKPILGITMGDPASIGPEITVKALSDPAIYEKCSPIIIGDAAVMEAAVGIVGKNVKINAVSDVKEAKFEFGTIWTNWSVVLFLLWPAMQLSSM